MHQPFQFSVLSCSYFIELNGQFVVAKGIVPSSFTYPSPSEKRKSSMNLFELAWKFFESNLPINSQSTICNKNILYSTCAGESQNLVKEGELVIFAVSSPKTENRYNCRRRLSFLLRQNRGEGYVSRREMIFH